MFFCMCKWSETKLKQIVVKIIVSKPFLLVTSFSDMIIWQLPSKRFVNSLQQVSWSPRHEHIQTTGKICCKEHLLVEQNFADEQLHLISLSTSGGAAEKYSYRTQDFIYFVSLPSILSGVQIGRIWGHFQIIILQTKNEHA